MKLNEYQKLAKRTIQSDLISVEIEYHALHGMVAELGEIHSLYQKDFQGHGFSRQRLKSELGDLLWFIAEFCTAVGFDLSEVAEENIEKLKARYPHGFESVRSINRKINDF